jgi:glycosyltransferase involved in cell wall biosynthesis
MVEINTFISIVTPSYNSTKYIRHTIQSVLQQSYPHYEHIVVDGTSSDGTVEILKE